MKSLKSYLTKCSACRTFKIGKNIGNFLVKPQQISASLEDYLEAIYEIIEEKKAVKAIDISRRLGVGRSSVTEALKSLADKKLVNYGRYDVLTLTAAGEVLAKRVLIRHSVLFEFFANILGVEKQEAQENACKVEHVITDDALRRLISFVEFNKRNSSQKTSYLEEYKKFHNEFL